MRIVVCVKQTYDPKTVRISRSREELDLREVVKITNPQDRYALESALRLRSAAGGEVIAVTVGDKNAEDSAREAVAIGADRAMLVVSPEAVAAGSGAVARALAAAIRQIGSVDLVLTGQGSATDGSGSLAPRLAAVLAWPVVIDVAALEANGNGGLKAVVALGQIGRTVPLEGTTVAAIVPGPERPRYPHPARIANAWQPGLVDICTPADLGLSAEVLSPEIEAGPLVLGPERVRGQLLSGSAEEVATAVVDILRARRII